MKILVVYYSLEGNTKKAAEKIASELSADVMPLIPVKDIPKKGPLKFLVGGGGATKRKGTELQPYSADASSYEAIIIGTPVWAGKPSMAMNQFLSDLKEKEKIIGAFAVSAGGDSSKCLAILKNTAPSIRFTLDLADQRSKKFAPANEGKIAEFIASIAKA
ncbi:MAG: NAD(P)H-dependent oxidoreductase [Clostridiales bacterium]|nr:NAD(P)H-dependent oxidoreductase [Clostridiales bacterium]